MRKNKSRRKEPSEEGMEDAKQDLSEIDRLADQNSSQSKFFFIVGPPRSGTKLLRGILNQSDQVSITPESYIFPKLLEHFGDKDPNEHQEQIIEMLKGSTYMERLDRNGFRTEFQSLVKEGDRTADLIRRFIGRVAYWQNPHARIIGDKTPSYESHLSMLHYYFPDADFVAIFRDPRDRALSIRSSWGKSMRLAAINWQKPVQRVLASKEELGDRLLLLRYETLLEHPDATVREVCQHLGIPFEERMLEEADSSEKLGSVKKTKGVARGNTGKYQSALSKEQIRRIEAIVFNEMRALQYPVHYAEEGRQVGAIEKFFLKLHDFIQNIRFHIQHKGWRRGVPFIIKMRKDKLK